MDETCRSCRRAPVEITEVLDDPAEPYRVCRDCYRRLRAHSLRPIEWYNLSTIHGRMNSLLGDEYYSETDGRALVPAESVLDSDAFPCPVFESVVNSPDDLLTYILTRNHIHEVGPVEEWFVDESLVSALKRHWAESLLRVFTARLATTRSVEQTRTLWHLVGLTLGDKGAGLVRDHWKGVASTDAFRMMAFAASRCLPLEEAHRKVTETLSGMNSRRRSVAKEVLRWFQTSLNLDWIEQNVESPVDSSWGLLAASSEFDWERARKWLSGGRPLSLVALDAMDWCLSSGRKPPLIHPPSASELYFALQDYLRKDHVPRVREKIESLLSSSRSRL